MSGWEKNTGGATRRDVCMQSGQLQRTGKHAKSNITLTIEHPEVNYKIKQMKTKKKYKNYNDDRNNGKLLLKKMADAEQYYICI